LLGTLHIDVNELMIVGAIGKLINAILVDGKPFGGRQLLAYPGFKFFERNSGGHGKPQKQRVKVDLRSLMLKQIHGDWGMSRALSLSDLGR
jgi:hypothetical protein